MLAGNFRVGHAERSAEAAALVGSGERDKFYAGELEKTLGAVPEADSPAVTRPVKRNPRRGIELGPFGDLEFLQKKLTQLKGVHVGFAGIEQLVPFPEHRRARGASADDRGIRAGEYLLGVIGDFPCRRPVAGVVRRLAAAGLGGGKLDGAAGVFEDPHGGDANLAKERIAQAGEHELNLHALTSVLNVRRSALAPIAWRVASHRFRRSVAGPRRVDSGPCSFMCPARMRATARSSE